MLKYAAHKYYIYKARNTVLYSLPLNFLAADYLSLILNIRPTKETLQTLIIQLLITNSRNSPLKISLA